MVQKLVIVGGSYSASEIAGSARDNGFDGEILLVSDEAELPYHRPPLSKAYLQGDAEATVLPLKGEKFYTDRKIDVAFNTRATSIDRRSKSVLFDNGRSMPFDKLAFACGARPRKLNIDGADLDGVFYLRSIADARRIKQAATDAADVVVIGGGFIGLEVAASLVQQSKRVTVVEAASHVLNRVVAPPISSFICDEHRKHGVAILQGRNLSKIRGSKGFVDEAVLDDGSRIRADLVVIGIGSLPNCELAENLDIACRNGIIVDKECRSSSPEFYAAGDCAFYSGPYTLGGMRLESVQNAMDQGRVAGAVIAGKERVYQDLPWFWSDQYKFKLQIAGVSFGADSFVVRSGSDGDICVFYFRSDTCIAVDTVNRPRDHMASRRLLAAGGLTRRRLMDVEFDVAALLVR